MGVCCCSLAGTVACRSCTNNPFCDRPPTVRTYTTIATDSVLITGQKTNADRIRAMTDEELAEQMCDHTCMLCPIEGCEGRIEEGRKKCKQYWLDWLKQEVDND